MKLSFSEMPDEARLWVFAAPAPLDETEEAWLRSHVEAFVDEWTAHGAPVAGAYDLRSDRFLLVAADEAATGVSGCSIDALTRTLKQAERELGISLLDAASRVWYREPSGEVRAAPRGEFRERVRTGEISGDTPVFDNTAPTVGAVRRGQWERPMRDSWHGRAFGQF
ncbi:MAG: hypothetical protein KY464_17160 [Gemmatimonadetes bacterium]|nr:hypothetical protein [Gemmatimonadota bacterium]